MALRRPTHRVGRRGRPGPTANGNGPEARTRLGTAGIVGAVSDPTSASVPPPDLDAIDADLDGVDTALRRLDDGTYWTDEVTGRTLDDELLAADPIARRANA